MSNKIPFFERVRTQKSALVLILAVVAAAACDFGASEFEIVEGSSGDGDSDSDTGGMAGDGDGDTGGDGDGDGDTGGDGDGDTGGMAGDGDGNTGGDGDGDGDTGGDGDGDTGGTAGDGDTGGDGDGDTGGTAGDGDGDSGGTNGDGDGDSGGTTGDGDGDTGTGGVSGDGGTGTGGGETVPDGPCDIYKAGGAPCAAAYSTIRRLKSDYEGPLYQVRVGSSEYNIGGQRVTNPITGPNASEPYTTTPEAGMLLDIPQSEDGFVNVSVLEEACKTSAADSLPVCSVVKLYDQSGNDTDLPLARAGTSNGGTFAPYDNFETVMNGTARLTVGGRTVYSLYMNPRNAYRTQTVGAAMPQDQEPQGIYMLADGTHTGSACCWEFGNISTNPKTYAEMNSLFFGQAFWGKGAAQPPWFGADFEAGVWMGGSKAGDPGWGEITSIGPANLESPSFAGVRFALGFLKTDDDARNTYALRMANISTATSITEAYRGDHPKWSYGSPRGTDNQGAAVLGVASDNSNNAPGTFYEGAIVAGFPSDATEEAVLKNIQAVGYGEN